MPTAWFEEWLKVASRWRWRCAKGEATALGGHVRTFATGCFGVRPHLTEARPMLKPQAGGMPDRPLHRW